MKIITLVLTCVLCSVGVLAQTETATNETATSGAVIQIGLARDDGNGAARDEEIDSFAPTDVPIHCAVRLSSLDTVTVKMNLVAVKLAGVKAETKIVTVVYKTNGKQNRVNFTGSPETVWAAGDYRIDLYIDDKKSGVKNFTIRPAILKTEDKDSINKDSANKESFQSKPKQKPKSTKRIKKN